MLKSVLIVFQPPSARLPLRTKTANKPMKTITNRILNWAARTRAALLRHHVSQDEVASIASTTHTAMADDIIANILTAVSDLKAEVTSLKTELASIRISGPDAEAASAANTQEASTEAASIQSTKEASTEATSAQSAKKAPALGTDRSAVIRFNKDFLAKHYDLRYNILKKTTEFRPKSALPSDSVITPLPSWGGAGGEASPLPPAGGVGGGAVAGEAIVGGAWSPLTDRDLNRLTVEQLEAGGGSWSYAMKLCIESSAIPDYNPVTAYLNNCPQWDGHDHIGDMARRVPTAYEHWPKFFHRWMLAMVAQVVASGSGFRINGPLGQRPLATNGTQECSTFNGNSMVPLLIGGQGLRKTTFCRSLLPPELREYFMDDIKMDSAEQVERVLARMWLVCIDEYNAKTPREQAKIKRLLTEKDVQVRRPRSEEYRLVPRIASFIATTNDPTPLPSGDGTRRYLCVEVEGVIDLPSLSPTDSSPQAKAQGEINYPQLYAQALAELQQGCRYWFDADDEAEIQRHNAPYQQASPLETVLPSLFEPTSDRCRENLWQVQAVQKVLAEKLRTADIPNLRQLSDAMKALRWPQGAVCGTRGYYLKMKSEE